MQVLFFGGLIVFLLFLSASFSGSESAYFSVTPWRLKRLDDEGKPYASSAIHLLRRPERLLVVILLGNETVNALISQLAAVINREINPTHSPAVTIATTVTVVSLLVILGEISPKGIALRRPVRFIRFTRSLLMVWWRITAPVAAPLEKLTRKLLARGSGDAAGEPNAGEMKSELSRIIALGADEGVIDRSEQQLLSNILELDDITVKDVITPRHTLSAVPATASVDDAVRIMRESGHSRLLVYGRDIDDIKGKIVIRDLIPHVKGGSPMDKPLKSYISPVLNVPEQISLKPLLAQLQRRRENMAVVFDEYGGTLGVVTLEDIIEEIVGDIRDSSDIDEHLIETLPDGSYKVEAKILLRDLNREIGFPLDGRFSALHGYLTDLFGSIPDEGDSARDKRFEYSITSIENQRIKEVIITPARDDKPQGRIKRRRKS